MHIWLTLCIFKMIADNVFSPIQKSLWPNCHFCASKFQVTRLETRHPMVEKFLGRTTTVESSEYTSTLWTDRLGGGTSCPAYSTETVHKKDVNSSLYLFHPFRRWERHSWDFAKESSGFSSIKLQGQGSPRD